MSTKKQSYFLVFLQNQTIQNIRYIISENFKHNGKDKYMWVKKNMSIATNHLVVPCSTDNTGVDLQSKWHAANGKNDFPCALRKALLLNAEWVCMLIPYEWRSWKVWPRPFCFQLLSVLVNLATYPLQCCKWTRVQPTPCKHFSPRVQETKLIFISSSDLWIQNSYT